MRDIALLHIGAFAPDPNEARTKASSVAADLIQRNLLEELPRAGLPEPDVFAYVPVPSYPANKKLVHFRRRIGEVRTLGHINLGPLKILSLGVNAAIAAALWGWRNRDADSRVVLCYNLTAPPAAFLLPICWLLRMDLVPYVGDVYVPGETVPNTFLRRLEFKVQTALLSKTKGLLVCNRSIAEDFAPKQNALLMDGGVPCEFIDLFRNPSPRNQELFTAVFAAELDDLDGIRMLLGAVEKLRDVENLRVKIFGRGKHRAKVETIAREDPRVEYFGFVPHEQLLEAYRSADLLLILRSTRMRTQRYFFPFKFIECLATGTPVLTTCTGHVEEEFSEFVHLLRDETPDGLAAAMRKLACEDRSELRALGAAAQRYVAQNKTWDAQGRRIKDYIEQLTQEAA